LERYSHFVLLVEEVVEYMGDGNERYVVTDDISGAGVL
jgi:hypothetical protein